MEGDELDVRGELANSVEERGEVAEVAGVEHSQGGLWPTTVLQRRRGPQRRRPGWRGQPSNSCLSFGGRGQIRRRTTCATDEDTPGVHGYVRYRDKKQLETIMFQRKRATIKECGEAA